MVNRNKDLASPNLRVLTKSVTRGLDFTIAVNACNMEPETIASIRIRKLDGGSTWKVQARVTRQLSQKRQLP